jgi:DNA-binding PadR family transcriptional regulator
VLQTFLAAPASWLYGYDISRATGVKSGTLYPILMRLEQAGLLDSRWEPAETGRPPRHMYQLNAEGIRAAREYVRVHGSRHSAYGRLAEAEG